jgi:outer membrane protein OmpA-like peptidoglycan-associated protein
MGISPYKELMSVVSYGDSKPVKRDVDSTNWDYYQTTLANNGAWQQSINRRIEIVLIYREKTPPEGN